jgi:predicted outer membrane lipoprotein
MTWVEVALVFAGIPAALFAIITALVLALADARVPDGLAGAAETDGVDDDLEVSEDHYDEARGAPDRSEPGSEQSAG